MMALPGRRGRRAARRFAGTSPREGQQFQFFNNDYPTLPLASTGLYKTGDIVKVRVEVSDRNPTNDAALAGCNDNDDFCQSRVPGAFSESPGVSTFDDAGSLAGLPVGGRWFRACRGAVGLDRLRAGRGP